MDFDCTKLQPKQEEKKTQNTKKIQPIVVPMMFHSALNVQLKFRILFPFS